MATVIVGWTKPYSAYNGHIMEAPLVQRVVVLEDRPGAREHVGEPRPVYSWAVCTDDCPRCYPEPGGDGSEPLEAFAGEEE